MSTRTSPRRQARKQAAKVKKFVAVDYDQSCTTCTRPRFLHSDDPDQVERCPLAGGFTEHVFTAAQK